MTIERVCSNCKKRFPGSFFIKNDVVCWYCSDSKNDYTRLPTRLMGINNRVKSLGHKERITLEEFNSLDTTACYYCKQTNQKLQVDHTIPLSKGGKHEIANLRMVCDFCNRAKSDRSEADFITWLVGASIEFDKYRQWLNSQP